METLDDNFNVDPTGRMAASSGWTQTCPSSPARLHGFRCWKRLSISTFVSCCQGFITWDKEALTALLIYLTLEEYLPAHSGMFNRPHSAIGEIPLIYLNSHQLEDPSDRVFCLSPKHTLPRILFGILAGACKKGAFGCARSLKLDLFKADYGQILTKLHCAQVVHLEYRFR